MRLAPNAGGRGVPSGAVSRVRDGSFPQDIIFDPLEILDCENDLYRVPVFAKVEAKPLITAKGDDDVYCNPEPRSWNADEA